MNSSLPTSEDNCYYPSSEASHLIHTSEAYLKLHFRSIFDRELLKLVIRFIRSSCCVGSFLRRLKFQSWLLKLHFRSLQYSFFLKFLFVSLLHSFRRWIPSKGSESMFMFLWIADRNRLSKSIFKG
jgi:hypothetical protein